MARYIDADNFCGWLETVLKDFGEPNISIRPVAYGSQNALRSVYDVMKNQPTADVVEVVRCKDCTHGHWNQEPYHGKPIYYCDRTDLQVDKYGFCSYGERK